VNPIRDSSYAVSCCEDELASENYIVLVWWVINIQTNTIKYEQFSELKTTNLVRLITYIYCDQSLKGNETTTKRCPDTINLAEQFIIIKQGRIAIGY
jgi:hypothetical protein